MAQRTGRRRLMAAATLAVTAYAAPAQAQDTGKGTTAVQLLKRGLDTFLSKDMKGWADLCGENVVAEFPFSPDPATRKLVGRAAVYAIDIKAIPTLKIHATVVTFRNGLMVNYREYWNPQAFMAAMAGARF